MAESIHVRKAQEMARALIAREASTGRDTGEAMRIASRKHGIPFSALWALRYRAPKDVFASVFFAIQTAYEATVADQERKLRHEIDIQKAKGALAEDSARQILDVAGCSPVEPR